MTIDDRLLKPAGWQYDDYQTAKQAILSDLLEIIGEDKKPFNTNFNRGMKPDIITKIENQLRQELRTKLKEYFGE